MNRRDFTIMFANQILFTAQRLKNLDMAVQVDWVLRSAHEQNVCFLAGSSKCDGYTKVSAHQSGKAADLLVIGPDGKGKLVLVDPMKRCPEAWKEVREHWLELGGEAMISWDACHFEVV
jgi:hypothetical protein